MLRARLLSMQTEKGETETLSLNSAISLLHLALSVNKPVVDEIVEEIMFLISAHVNSRLITVQSNKS